MERVFSGKSASGVDCDPMIGRGSGLRHFGVSKSLDFETVRYLWSSLERSENQNNTITNVLASIVVSALGQVLSRRGDISDNSTLTFSTPTAILPHPDSQPRNAVVPNNFCLPFGELAKHHDIQLIDVSPSLPGTPTHYLLSCVGRLPGRIAGNIVKFVCQWFPASTVFTSVPATRVKGSLACCGSFVSDVGGWSVLPRQIGVSIVAISYGGGIRFWCVVDEAIMNHKDFDDFLDLLIVERQY
ncbi:uncharacterized protein LOC118438589 [Folsomia candida]|nr:uncharacterized protein LOC118438589 [Folsomia candida]